jgi:hypothetical protein
VVDDGVLTLTDRDGKSALDDRGYRYSKKLSAGDNPKIIAGRLTRELRSALRGKDAPAQGFDEPIKYFRDAQWANRIAIVAVVIAAISLTLAMFK